jgi:hypothetical protein
MPPKHDYKFIKKYVEDKGFTLLSKTYKGCKEKLQVICDGKYGIFHEIPLSFDSMKRGYGCNLCALFKRKETYMKEHGYENPSQDPKIKKKKKETNLERRGVEYASQDPKIKEKVKQTNLERRGVENPLQSEEVRDKIKQTNLEKYGVENPFQSEEIKEKIKNTNLGKYGVEYAAQNQQVKDKIKETVMERYGVEYALQDKGVREKGKETILNKYGVEYITQNEDIKEKVKKTVMEKYGVEYVFQNEDVKEKIKNTNIERYGVEHHMQNAEVAEKVFKKGFSAKYYTFPSGRTVKIQGYENFALDGLIKIYDENDIIVGALYVPKISWIDAQGKKHIYYPDIYIKSINKLYEVKSTWTMSVNIEENIAKWDAAINASYKFEVRVYDKKGEMLDAYLWQ